MKKLILLIFIKIALTVPSSYPVAIFHGIGDNCDNPGMQGLTELFSNQLDGAYVKCIESGDGISSWDTSFIQQAEAACTSIKLDANFVGDFSVVGISQGSLIARYIIEACDMPGTVKRYVSIGGPQMGVGKFPHCEEGPVCWTLEKIIDLGVYTYYAQTYVGPAGYFKVISDYEDYLNYSTFLANLNNERSQKNPSYRDRMLKLEKLQLIKFSDDTMIIPKETAWFQFWDSDGKIINFEDSDLYKQDFVGLKQLNEDGRISFVELPGQHLHFNSDDVVKYMIPQLK
jgi:palmitoyl-protein thioesterase